MRVLVLVATAVAAAGLLGFVAGRQTANDKNGAAEPARLIAEGTLAALPRAPVLVRAEQVVLPAGFRSKHVHGGPTFNFVEDGAVVIEQASGERARYSEGTFFFEPAGRAHEITVLEDARLRVVRLLPPGEEATTEVP